MIALAASLAYALTFQATYYGDASLLLKTYRQGALTGHAGHGIATRLFTAVGFELETAMQIVSALPAGLSVGIMAMTLLRLGAGRGAALLATLFFALTPSVLFFGTTIEVHGLQLLGVSLAMYAGIRAFGECSALRMVAREPQQSLPEADHRSALPWFALAVIALAATHPMNLPALAGLSLLALMGLSRRGVTSEQLAAFVAILAVLGIGLALAASAVYKSRQGLSMGGLLQTFAWPLGEHAPDGSGAPALFYNFRAALLLPAAGLLGIGSLGLLFLRSLMLGMALALWVLFPFLLVLGIDAHEHGAYFLVALPALTIGATAILEQLAVWAERSFGKRGPLVTSLLVAYAFASMGHDNYRNQPKLESFEDRSWLEAFGSFADGRGVFLAQDIQHQLAVRSHLGLQSENLRFYIALPEAELMEYMRVYRTWAREAADHGDPLYISEAVFDLAPSLPVLQLALDYLAKEFDFEHIYLGEGYGIWRGE